MMHRRTPGEELSPLVVRGCLDADTTPDTLVPIPMNSPRLLLPFALCVAIPCVVAFRPAADKLDLRPRFEAGQTFTINQTFSFDGALDELEVVVDGAPVLDGGAITVEMAVSGEVEMTETIVDVREGQIAKIRLALDVMDVAITGEFDAMGEGDTLDEVMETELVGRTIEITVDEAGELTHVDVTEDAEPLAESAMAGLTQKNHFEMLLPKEPVEVGTAFALAPDWQDLVREAMAEMDMSDMEADEAAAMEGMARAFVDATTIEAVGKVTGIEGDVATIEYEMTAKLDIDDLLGLIQSLAPGGELDELPPGIESTIEGAATITGTGLFDLSLGQLTSLELAGALEATLSGNADIEGTSASAEMLSSGTFELKASLSVE